MANDYASIRVVVFDAVGTLIYANPPVANVYERLGRQHGSNLTNVEIEARFRGVLKGQSLPQETNEQIERIRWRTVVDNVFTDVTETQPLFEELWEHFARSTSWSTYGDVSKVIAELHQSKLKVAIGSNFDERLLAIARVLAPLQQIREVFISSQIGFAKPSIEFFREVERRLDILPHELLMVGDDVGNDFDGAANAGWHSLLLDRDGLHDAKQTIRSLREIPSLLS